MQPLWASTGGELSIPLPLMNNSGGRIRIVMANYMNDDLNHNLPPPTNPPSAQHAHLRHPLREWHSPAATLVMTQTTMSNISRHNIGYLTASPLAATTIPTLLSFTTLSPKVTIILPIYVLTRAASRPQTFQRTFNMMVVSHARLHFTDLGFWPM